MEKAVAFNIMRYSIHDGPGIRTTVFFKGCPLSCKWCHNPESLDQKPQQIFYPQKCIKCGNCNRTGGEPSLANARSAGGSGHYECPTGARETIGYEITLPELMKEIKKDNLFYEQSGGGVTFSGGEPFFQAQFLLAALTQCKKEYINTAIDTSGYCNTEIMLKAAETADYFLYDIKFVDSKKHAQYCGVPNDLILKNLEHLAKAKTKILLRIPVIPTVNDDMREMTDIFKFVEGFTNIETVHLLPYHNIHSDKYKRLGKQYELCHEDGSEISGDESPNLNEIKGIFETKFRTKVGG